MKIGETNNGSEKDYIDIEWFITKNTITFGMYSDASVAKQFLFISGARLITLVKAFRSYVMKWEQMTGLSQADHVHNYLWHIYSVSAKKVMTKTFEMMAST
jgi:hypothetical protein